MMNNNTKNNLYFFSKLVDSVVELLSEAMMLALGLGGRDYPLFHLRRGFSEL